jgi:RND family efflux transporter MFP subunit
MPPLAASVLLGVALLFLSVRFLRQETAGTTAPAQSGATRPSPAATARFLKEQQWLIRMKLAVAQSKTVARQIRSTGRVIPAVGYHATLSSPVSGILAESVLPRVGQQVRRGETLAGLTQTPTAAEALTIAAANAMVQIETARIEAERRRLTELANEARARMLLAIVEAEHAKRLFDHKAYSLNQWQQAQHDLKRAETDYDAARRQLEALDQISIPAIDREPRRHVLAAPIAGTVVRVHKSIGERVGAGEPILEIVNLARVWVEAPLFERDLGRLSGEVRPSFSAPALPGRRFRGSLVNIGAVIDERTRAATVLFELANPDRVLRIGMEARVQLDSGEEIEAVLVPKESVLEVDGRKYVYVLISGEEFERREVSTADEIEGQVVVEKGLTAGERVVTRGAYQLHLQGLRPAEAGAHTHEN